MNSTVKMAVVMAAVAATGLLAGCGGGSGGGAAGGVVASATTNTPSTAPAADGAALYADNCARCHGALAASSKKDVTLGRLQSAIANNAGGMNFLSSLSTTEQQAIVAALNPAAAPPSNPTTPTIPSNTTVDGAALYAANCAGCHGPLASSKKAGATTTRIQTAIANNAGGMGSLSSLSAAQINSLATSLASAPVATVPPTTVTDGPTLYATNCARCHGPLATSAKGGATSTRIQNAIANNSGGMGSLSSLSATQIGAIATSLATVTVVTVPPTTVTDGPTLYATNCARCHGPLATSAKGGATSTRIQNAIANNSGGMGSLSSLSAIQIGAIATSLAGVTGSQAAVCGSCHAIPPASGQHARHKNRGITCDKCHGSGYSTTSFNTATHNNGVKNLISTTGWNSASRSCANSCHNRETW